MGDPLPTVAEHTARIVHANRRTNWTIRIVLVLTCVAIVAIVWTYSAKQDHRIDQIAKNVDHVVAVQKMNTARSKCQDASFNAVIQDVRLAFAGDQNASDYAVAPTTC